MKIVLVYIYPSTLNGQSDDYVCRFLNSYAENKTSVDHESIVVLNGGKPNSYLTCMFSCLQNMRFFEHDDSGWDIGAYQHVAAEVPADLMVFIGTTTWIKGPGWLERIAGSFKKHGDNLYGVMGNQGMGPVHPHIRTTGFWMSPSLLNSYHTRVVRHDQRYPFEHGQKCLTRHVWDLKKKVFVVTWYGEYEYPNWDSIPNGFHRGNQSALLMGDRISDPPFYPIP